MKHTLGTWHPFLFLVVSLEREDCGEASNNEAFPRHPTSFSYLVISLEREDCGDLELRWKARLVALEGKVESRPKMPSSKRRLLVG